MSLTSLSLRTIAWPVLGQFIVLVYPVNGGLEHVFTYSNGRSQSSLVVLHELLGRLDDDRTPMPMKDWLHGSQRQDFGGRLPTSLYRGQTEEGQSRPVVEARLKPWSHGGVHRSVQSMFESI